MPFRAFSTLDKLLEKGLMERIRAYPGYEEIRATQSGRDYRCYAPGCHRGALYAEGEDGRDHEIGRCRVCDGTGVTLKARALR